MKHKRKIPNILDDYIRLIIKEEILSEIGSLHNQSGQNASIWAGSGNLQGIPNVEGIEVSINRYGNDIRNPQYSVEICVTDDSTLNSGLRVFRDENDAKHFARQYVDNLARSTKYHKKVVE